MNTRSNIAILLFLFILQGCVNITEELTLREDGSGTYVYTMDLGAFVKADDRYWEMKAMDYEFNSTFPPMIDSMVVYDTTHSLLAYTEENNPGAVAQMPEVMKKVTFREIVDQRTDDVKYIFTLDFDDISEVNSLIEQLNEIGASMKDPDIKQMAPLASVFSSQGTMLERKAKRGVPNYSNGKDKGGMPTQGVAFADLRYKTIYHLPKAIQESTIADAAVEGKTVTKTYPYLDVMSGKVDLSGLIKY